MEKILFDTAILVDHLRDFKPATDVIVKVRNKEILGRISALTEAELFAGKDSAIESKRRLLSDLISLFVKIHVDNEISKKAGDFKRKYGVPLDDCIIAATAYTQNAKIWTKNLEEFRKIKDIQVEEPY
jgi:predicted nucleic acid-binding protein